MQISPKFYSPVQNLLQVTVRISGLIFSLQLSQNWEKKFSQHGVGEWAFKTPIRKQFILANSLPDF
jgi:hypothetical protein